MAEYHKISDSELMKILVDPKKVKILDILKKEHLTVAQIAKRLGQKPSRLYYHVNKLEEAELIQLKETRQNGNLIEKYYGIVPKTRKTFEFDPAMVAENHHEVMEGIVQTIQPGLALLEDDLKSGQKSGVHVDYDINYSDFTEKEWRASHEKMIASIEDAPAQSDRKKVEETNRSSEKEKKDRYVHIILSYRLSDADHL
ncbi:MAG TPA: winged helix-turn-helix domain-containing protein [Bacillales bacterium]|nr:winged helix-turn-helix domain-containing protein [Bacillales bacterium]